MENLDLPKPQTDLPLPEKEIPATTGAKFSILKSKFFISFVIISTLIAFLIGGIMLGKTKTPEDNSPKEEILTPSPTKTETNIPKNWVTYKVEEINLEYKLPPEFPPLKKSVNNGETGKQIYISSSNTKAYVGPILLGTTSFDYTAGRGGLFVDLQGYTKQGSTYLAKFVSGKSFEIADGLAQEIINENGIKILIIKGKNYQSDPNGLPEAGTPGENKIGALINTSDSYYPGFAIEMELSDKYNEETFNRILSTLKLTDPTNPKDDMVFCTQEAKLCPDGSYVGRSGPKCEFTPCPTQ